MVVRLLPQFASPAPHATAAPDAALTWEHRPLADTRDLNETLEALSARSQRDRKRDQRARLDADMDKLAVLESYDPALTKALYGDDWQIQVEAHRHKGERAEFVATVAIVVTSLGAILSGWCLLLGLARLLIRAARYVTQRVRSRGETAQPSDAAQGVTMPPVSEPHTDAENAEADNRHDPSLPHAGNGKARSVATFSRGPRYLGSASDEETLPYRRVVNPLQDHCLGNMAESVSMGQMPGAPAPSTRDTSEDALPILLDSDEVPAVNEFIRWEASLKSQTAVIEQQMAEVKAVARSVRDSAAEGSEPVNQALLSLNAQMSAIREFASEQQDRVEKLQNGYDWNIIRTFCLRIIRCIDNIELQMSDAKGRLDEAHPFAEIRDELLFALESSGVEQFEPEVRSLFRGQERSAEAIQQKQSTKDPALKGCIAHVLKPGYQYVLDEETLRVVRSARVKLYA